jgi:hypothetical protein
MADVHTSRIDVDGIQTKDNAVIKTVDAIINGVDAILIHVGLTESDVAPIMTESSGMLERLNTIMIGADALIPNNDIIFYHPLRSKFGKIAIKRCPGNKIAQLFFTAEAQRLSQRLRRGKKRDLFFSAVTRRDLSASAVK